MVRRRQLYSMREVERQTTIDRRTIRGLVIGLDLPTYSGPGGSLAVDEAGLQRILIHLDRFTTQATPLT